DPQPPEGVTPAPPGGPHPPWVGPPPPSPPPPPPGGPVGPGERENFPRPGHRPEVKPPPPPQRAGPKRWAMIPSQAHPPPPGARRDGICLVNLQQGQLTYEREQIRRPVCVQELCAHRQAAGIGAGKLVNAHAPRLGDPPDASHRTATTSGRPTDGHGPPTGAGDVLRR